VRTASSRGCCGGACREVGGLHHHYAADAAPPASVSRRFWSLLPPQDVPIPRVEHANQPRNAIDHFILAKLEEKGLALSPQADKRTLIRRITYDLTGLPPTVAEIEAFLVVWVSSLGGLGPNEPPNLVERPRSPIGTICVTRSVTQ
jgi:hypothetical protein